MTKRELIEAVGVAASSAAQRILVLDDDEWFADSLAKTIRQQLSNSLPGRYFMVQPATTIDRALDLIDDGEKLPRLIVSDFHLGQQNFFTLVNELASYEDTDAIAKIILSSSGDRINPADVHQYGVAAVLDKKTFQMNDLINTIMQELA